MSYNKNCAVLSPFFVFLSVFVGSGVYFSMQGIENAFYQISPNIAIIPAIVLAIALSKGTFTDRINYLIKGMGNNSILIMCLIYLLSGAFTTVTKNIGCIEATVNFGLHIIPNRFLLPGIFLISSFMATALGTSMGVVAAYTPLAVGIAEQTGINLYWCVGTVIGGAIFGDNLSAISDTTIASVNTQQANLKKKVILNTIFALPAMIITLIILSMINDHSYTTQHNEYSYLKVLPYLCVLLLPLLGLNVIIVLLMGIIISAIIGITCDNYTIVKLSHDINHGFSSMNEILILSLLIGGLSFLVNNNGGFEYIVSKVNKLSQKRSDKRFGELIMAIIASCADICTANNTIAIILSGDIVKKMAKQYKITPEKSACIIDIFSCVFQGILPYSAQLLLACSIANISPVKIMLYVLYCPLLALTSIIIIFLQTKTQNNAFFRIINKYSV